MQTRLKQIQPRLEPWLLDAFELFMLNVSCNSHCFLALCCALHRITSRVIHRTELFFFCIFTFDSYSMTNNNDLLNGKVYKQDSSDMCTYATSCFIHNGATQSHRNLCDCAKFVCVDDRIEETRTKTVMIHTQVHLRIPCYDFYFL